MARSAAAESVFQAIACPTRRALLDALSHGESNVTALVAALEVTQSAVSQQLAILKSAGLVAERVEGRFRYYRLRARPLSEVVSWIAQYRAHLELSLDALGEVLDDMPDRRPRQPSARKNRRGKR
jgi:DNA-binding transcriptional ArsR family regulator